jgi:hypothetical protein
MIVAIKIKIGKILNTVTSSHVKMGVIPIPEMPFILNILNTMESVQHNCGPAFAVHHTTPLP